MIDLNNKMSKKVPIELTIVEKIILKKLTNSK